MDDHLAELVEAATDAAAAGRRVDVTFSREPAPTAGFTFRLQVDAGAAFGDFVDSVSSGGMLPRNEAAASGSSDRAAPAPLLPGTSAAGAASGSSDPAVAPQLGASAVEAPPAGRACASGCTCTCRSGPDADVRADPRLARAGFDQMMAATAACLHPGVTGGLVSLHDAPLVPVPTAALLAAEVPLVRSLAPTPSLCFARHPADVYERLRAAFPAIPQPAFLRRHGIVAAGGAVAAALAYHASPEAAFGVRSQCGDIDFFLVGHADDAARGAAVAAFVKKIRSNAAKRARRVWGYRTPRSLTLDLGDRECYQLVFRAYSTLAEVLHGFDNGACAVAHDGRDVFLSQLGLFAAETRLNVLSLTARRSSYEHRLAKYFARGFGLVLPSLAVGPFVDPGAFGVRGQLGAVCFRGLSAYPLPGHLRARLQAEAIEPMPVIDLEAWRAFGDSFYGEDEGETPLVTPLPAPDLPKPAGAGAASPLPLRYPAEVRFAPNPAYLYAGPAEGLFAPGLPPVAFLPVDSATLLTPGAAAPEAVAAWYGRCFELSA